jgi:hypothetical protein
MALQINSCSPSLNPAPLSHTWLYISTPAHHPLNPAPLSYVHMTLHINSCSPSLTLFPFFTNCVHINSCSQTYMWHYILYINSCSPPYLTLLKTACSFRFLDPGITSENYTHFLHNISSPHRLMLNGSQCRSRRHLQYTCLICLILHVHLDILAPLRVYFAYNSQGFANHKSKYAHIVCFALFTFPVAH